MDKDNNVTQWMVDQLVSPEVQAQIAETYEGITMDSVRLAWPFKTEEEREVIRKWIIKQNRIRKAEVLKMEKALM